MKLLYEVKPIHRDSVALTNLPDHVKYAILGAEDRRFYSHPGVDPKGLLRAVFRRGSGQDGAGGGSTITMQLAKKLFSASEMTMKRKVQDIGIAIEMEKRYTKDQILEMYINQIYYGEQAYGLNAAAEIYFNKEAKDLDLAEAAMIARCIRLPSTQNPVKNYQIADTNKKVVLSAMLEEHWITEDEYEKAKAEKPKVRGLSRQKFSHTESAPYFVAAVKRDLEKQGINISEGGYTVVTTLDSEVQSRSEQAVERGIRRNEANVGAFICMDSEGRILADVGGRDFRKNQFSYTTQSPLQPGSSFKSFIYAEAIRGGVINSLDSEVNNNKVQIGTYIPSDHHGAGGTVEFIRAFAQSWNFPAINTLMTMTPEVAMPKIKEDFGFDSKLRAVPSAALGSNEVKAVEMLEGYSVFMLNGKRVQPRRILEIQDPNNEVIYQSKMEYVNTNIGPGVCEIMDKAMEACVKWGTGTEAGSCPDAHGKTGTTNDGKSLWFCGYAKGVVGIAVAANQHYDRKRKKWLLGPLEQFGGDVAAPIWADAMNAAIERHGSDVKPDFSKARESASMRHKKEEPAANNEENPIPDDANNEPAGGDTNIPVTIDHGDGANTPPTSPVDDPRRDPASNPGKVGDIPPKTDTRTKPDDSKKVRDDNEMVEVEICADSGLLATKYCQETITKTYPKNKKPKRRCNLHKAPVEGGGGQ